MELREIKFRAYADGKIFNNVGVVGNIIVLEYDSCEDDYGVDLELNYYGLNDDSIKLMQFTGLHDKNGKEIYEGDVYDIGICMKVVRPSKFIEDTYELSQMLLDNARVEVIGSIYENPELLKEEVK